MAQWLWAGMKFTYFSSRCFGWITSVYNFVLCCILFCFDVLHSFLRQLTPATWDCKGVLCGDLGPSRRILLAIIIWSSVTYIRRSGILLLSLLAIIIWSSVTYIRRSGILLLSGLYPLFGSSVTYIRQGGILLLSGLYPLLGSSVTYIRQGGILLLQFFIGLMFDQCCLRRNIRRIILLLILIMNAFVYYIYSWYFFKCSMFHGRGSFCPSIVSRW